MNVLSLFDGISTGRYCLEQCGVPVENYVACEIDKYAITISKAHYPDIIQMGDVCGIVITYSADQNLTTVKNIISGKTFSFTGKFDMIIGGSPCQGFSFAGKQLNFNDPRSILLFEYVDLLNSLKEHNPDIIFFLENVMMKQQFQDVISELLGAKPIKLNSALVCAQNRKRLYWTNIPYYGEPQDRGILLKDILQDEFCHQSQDNKSFCLTSSSYSHGATLRDYNRSTRQLIRIRIRIRIGNVNPSGQGMNGVVYDIYGKSLACTTNKGEGSIIGLVLEGFAGDIKGFDNNRRIYSQTGKAPTILSSTGGHKAPKVGIIQRARGFNKGGFHEEKSPPITSNSRQENNKLLNGVHYRKLTVTECERLQGMPDRYTQALIPAKKQISATQSYKMLGAGWQADTICYLFQPIADADIL